MRRNYFNATVSINKEFNSEEVNSNLDKFSNVLVDGCLVTSFAGREICRTDVSKVYYNFDFSNFSKSIISEIVKYFSPEKYALKAASGVQEIKLVGDEIFIDNEKYQKMISIVNSTDKSRALSMNVGLVKLDNRGHIVSSFILTTFTNKHYVASLPDKIKSFSDNLINFNMDIDFHIKTIEDLKNNEVSIVKLAKTMMFDKDDKVIKTVELKMRALGTKLMYNYGFRNYYNTLSNLTASNLDKIQDLNINSKVIFDAYMELFNNKDTAVSARESRRIIDGLEKIINS